jgi:hypothetical protein
MSEEQEEDEMPCTSVARISKKSRWSGESVKLRKAYASVSKVSNTFQYHVKEFRTVDREK